jgi:hypothetical protein
MCAADRFEPNNSFAAATDFGTIGLRVETGLNVHVSNDDDYFQFKPEVSGSATVSISFVHAQGDLDLLLYNSAHSIIGSSTGISNTETITKPVTAGQTYFVLVFESNSGTSPNYDLTIDSPARPAATTTAFDFQTSHNLLFHFNKDVESSLAPGDVTIVDEFNVPVTGPNSVSYDSGTDTATFHLPTILPDGDYTATLSGAGVEDNFGNTMAADVTVPLFVFQADADHSRTIDTVDFNLLASNFGGTGKTFGQGDFNYDTAVDTVDFNILASRFSQVLDAPVAARVAPAQMRQPHELFADRPIDVIDPLPV